MDTCQVQGKTNTDIFQSKTVLAHLEITFKRPHWNNSVGFIESMEELCQEYKQLNTSEGLWGNVTEGYVKHDFQVS